jgi:hypothetical protein
MGAHMKTTIEISDNLLRRAKATMARDAVTLRTLVEEGLGLALARRAASMPVRVEPVTFRGDGLQPEFAAAGWAQVRDAAYETGEAK